MRETDSLSGGVENVRRRAARGKPFDVKEIVFCRNQMVDGSGRRYPLEPRKETLGLRAFPSIMHSPSERHDPRERISRREAARAIIMVDEAMDGDETETKKMIVV